MSSERIRDDYLRTNLIIGCGYLGSRVAKLWLEQDRAVAALTRRRIDELSAQGITPVVGNVLVAGVLGAVPPAATVLYCVGMDRSEGRSFREVFISGLKNVLDSLQSPARFIYVSSTSVYGQTDGEEVDESSPTEPREENGKIVWEAEQLLREKLPSAIILRFAGIYGPGRVIRRAAIEKGEPLVGDVDKWLNLIHVDDGARAILAAEKHGRDGETYLIADGQPVRRRDFYSLMATLLQAPPARFEPLPSGAPLPPHEGGNRRISNRKMREELDVRLRFPDYRAGLQAMLAK